MVNQGWLNAVRNKNQQSVGLAGMGSSDDIVAAARGETAAAVNAAAIVAAKIQAVVTPQSLAGKPTNTSKYLLYGAVGIVILGVAVRAFRNRN